LAFSASIAATIARTPGTVSTISGVFATCSFSSDLM
jgi:hypothetical protein